MIIVVVTAERLDLNRRSGGASQASYVGSGTEPQPPTVSVNCRLNRNIFADVLE